MYHLSTQDIDERVINVPYYYYPSEDCFCQMKNG